MPEVRKCLKCQTVPPSRWGPGGALCGRWAPAPKRKAQLGLLCQSNLVHRTLGLGSAGCGFKPENSRAAMRFGLFSPGPGWLCSACLYGRDLVDGGLLEL